MVTVTIDAKRWERVVTVAEAAKEWTDAPSGNLSSENILIQNADRLKRGDLDPVAPVAPDPGLRDALAKAAFDFDYSIGEVADDWSSEWERLEDQTQDDYRGRADAALTVLAESGMRSPNLPTIARFLAEHPETVDALDRLTKEPTGGIMRTGEGDQFAHFHQQDTDKALLRGLIAAMRGESGHE